MVRLMKNTDFKDVCRIRRQVHALHVKGRPDIYRMPDHPAETALFDGSLRELYEDENYLIIVSESDTCINGYAVVKRVLTQHILIKQDRSSYFVDEFGVDDAFRRQGIGTEMMKFICSHAKENHADAVDLDVWAFNSDAEAFYRFLGMTAKHTFLELPITNKTMKSKGE